MIQVDMRKSDMFGMAAADNGWGIREEDNPHLAECFYRGRHGNRVKGTVLSLSSVKRS